MATCKISILEMVSISTTSRLEQQHTNYMTVIISGTNYGGMRCLRLNQSVNRRRKRILVSRLTQKSVRILHAVDTLQNGATVTLRCLIVE